MTVTEGISLEELQLAARNHGMPLEALRYSVTPVGLHYLLTHYDIPLVDAQDWQLPVGGLVRRELSLTLEEIRARPAIEVLATMECAGNGRARLSPRPFSQPWLEEAVGTARWRGTALAPLLEEAGLGSDAVEVVFTGLDRGIEGDGEQIFARSLTVEQALGDGAILAYEINGQPLPPQHGFPVRLVVPGWYGMTNVKWLARIEAVAEPFTGPQQSRSYRIRLDEDDPGVPLTRMLPRALMVPPGTPHFPSRHRTVPPGDTVLEGRAWSGWAPIERVEVSTDGGRTWTAAELERDVESTWAWWRWRHTWAASPGEAELCCRATDGEGNVQPLEPAWNVGGYGNNAVQRVPVTVAPI
jgi:DMSO/TMAO reductase YedYZ molybdopterin-dependent catalytic subunit